MGEVRSVGYFPTPDMAEATEGPGASDPPPALVRALRRLLVPLVRLLLANRVTLPSLTRLLKEVFVEVAEREFAIEGRPQTTSRLSLLTGIHRKDVKRIREAPSDGQTIPRNVSLGAQLVARWTGRPEFLDAEGAPRPLPRLSSRDGRPSFESLVASVSKDIRARAVLDEWLRLGVVHIDASDRVCLETGAFVPEHGFDEKAHYLGRNLHDHIATAARNLGGGAAPLLERSVYYDELAPESVAELQSLAESRGMEVLQEVNRRALDLQERDAGGEAANRRMSFGVYFHEGEDPGVRAVPADAAEAAGGAAAAPDPAAMRADAGAARQRDRRRGGDEKA